MKKVQWFGALVLMFLFLGHAVMASGELPDSSLLPEMLHQVMKKTGRASRADISQNPDDLKPMLGTTWEFSYNGQTDTLTFLTEPSTDDDGEVTLVYYDQNFDFGMLMYSELSSELELGERGFIAVTLEDMEEPKHAYIFTIAGDTATGYRIGEFTDPYPLTGRKISGGESVPDLSGLWVHEDWGEMSISQDGQQVNATYTNLSSFTTERGFKVGDQAFYGTFEDQNLSGKLQLHFPVTYQSACPDQWTMWGDLALTLSEDGDTLQGQAYHHNIHEDCSITDLGWDPFTLTRETSVSPDTGHLVTPNLWIRAVIQTEDKGPIEAVWQQGGDDTMAGGHRVIWGYFYASPDDVSWGSKENPDLFVKIWFDAGGRTDVNFFHVSVPEIDVYSDYEYDGTPDEHGVTTMSRRYIRQWYENGQSHTDQNYEDGIPASGYYPAGSPSGYSTINGLRTGSVINTDGGPIDAVWYQGGSSATAGGHEVLWGYFYASPNDVGWGSRNNPDLFVKVWFDASGRVDVNYFHVSVPDIEVYSDLPSDSSYDKKGTTILDDRYIRHEFSYTPSADTSNHKPVAYPLSLATDMTIPYLEKQLIATDTDGDRLNYELIAPSSGSGYSEAFISPSSGVLYVTLSDDGTDLVTLPYHVSDGKIFSDSADITVELTDSSEERFFGSEEIDPRIYSGFALASFRSDLLGAPGDSPTVPRSIDLSSNFPVPGDQKHQGSCVGWATAYALKTYQEKVEMGWSLNPSSHIFSPAFIYNQINGGQDRGSLIWEALDIIVNKGCATLDSMPYEQDDYRTQPNAQAVQEALGFKAREWKRLSSTPAAIIAALVNRNPVVVSIDAYESLGNLSGSDSVYNTIGGGDRGRHAVTIVGYDDNKYGGAFKVINSWGTGWGDRGYFWIPYNSTMQIGMNEAYILEDAENSITPDPNDDPVRPPEPADELPNFQVKSWSADYDPKPRGQGTLEYKVVNTGNDTAPSGADVNFMLSQDETLVFGDIYVIYEEIPFDLESGYSVFRDENNPISFQFPDTLEDGTYYMAIWVDDLNKVKESDENDNVSWGSTQVTIENLLPDLEVQTWYAEWNDYGYGTLTYEVANNGKTVVSGTEWDINLVLSPDEEIGNGNEIFLFYEDGNYALEPGYMISRDEDTAASFYLYEDAFGRSVPAGTYYVAVWVDDLNKVDESNELNNSSTGWSVIEIGGNSRSLKEVTARNAYNGRRLPSPDILMRKVQIKRTADGGRSLKFLDEEPVSPKIGETTSSLSKTMSSKNHVIFPVVKEIPMPEAIINNPGSSRSKKNTAAIPRECDME